MPREDVARHQQGRLQGAMVEAVARHGYAGTTLRELVGMAGVSKTTFYEHYSGKEECFLATMDEIIAAAVEEMSAAYAAEEDFRGKLEAALRRLFELVAAQRDPAWLAVVEAPSLGAPGIKRWEESSTAFEELLRQGFEEGAPNIAASPVTIRVIAAGFRGIVYRRLRAGEEQRLPEHVDELVDWALSYEAADSETVKRAQAAAAEQAGKLKEQQADEQAGPGWDEPPDSDRSRAELSQRERIIRAAARVAVEKGYAALSIPAISGAAGVSNQTFYEHFSSKLDAILAANDAMAERILKGTAAAYESQDDWVSGIGAAVQALLTQISNDPLFARLAAFEIVSAGPTAVDRGDEWINAFVSYLRPEIAPAEMGTLSPVTIEAIAAGGWGLIQHEVAQDRVASLPELAPDLIRIVLAPFAERERSA